jgi:hypothetical protein
MTSAIQLDVELSIRLNGELSQKRSVPGYLELGLIALKN